MIAIGNGEKCPFCDKVMKDFKIDGQNSMQHIDIKEREYLLIKEANINRGQKNVVKNDRKVRGHSSIKHKHSDE